MPFLRKNHKNDNKGEFADFHPLYDFRYLLENDHSDNGYFREKFKNHI